MASILKPRNLPAGVSLQQIEDFNWEDVVGRARSHIEQVRLQARAIIEDARTEVQKIRDNARDEGRRAAQNELESMAVDRAKEMADQRIRESLQTAAMMTDELEKANQQWLRQWQHETIPLAISIAERLVRRQIDIDPTVLLQWITDSIALARAQRSLKIRIHPADRKRLGTHLDQFIKASASKHELELVDDETLTSPGVIIEAEDLEIDACLRSQLDRLEQEMQ